MPPTDLVLHYLPVCAKAEPLRMMLRHGGVPFTDTVHDWPAWAEAKAAHRYPFDRLPVLETGGRQLAESGALARLIARWAGLMPEDELEAAAVDMVHQAAQDLEEVEPIYNGFTTEPAKIEAYFALFATRFQQLQRLLGDKHFFGGAKPAYADVTAFHWYNLTTRLRPAAADGLPAMQAWAARVAALPAVAAELAKQPPPTTGAPAV